MPGPSAKWTDSDETCSVWVPSHQDVPGASVGGRVASAKDGANVGTCVGGCVGSVVGLAVRSTAVTVALKDEDELPWVLQLLPPLQRHQLDHEQALACQ